MYGLLYKIYVYWCVKCWYVNKIVLIDVIVSFVDYDVDGVYVIFFLLEEFCYVD